MTTAMTPNQKSTNQMDLNEVAMFFKIYRDDNDLTQEELAEIVEVHVNDFLIF